MIDPGATGTGAARLDGLLNLTFSPDPGREREAALALGRLAAAVSVALNVQQEPGLVTLMPDSTPFKFPAASRPSETLLPILRGLVDAVGPGVSVESSLRLQEFLGDTVREGVFVAENGELTLTARERRARPEERPTLPEPSMSERAESLFRRHRGSLVLLAVAVLVVGFVGWQMGWWNPGAGLATGPAIDAGPLTGIVTVERVRWSQKTLLFDLSPGPDFAGFKSAAEGCSLQPGLFRVLLEEDGKLVPGILVLDLRDLPVRMAKREGDGPLVVRVPSPSARFDRVLICR